MHSKHFILFLLCISPILYFCGGSIPETHYYLIDYPIATSNASDTNPIEIVLGVGNFKSDPLYANEKIVYRENNFEGKYYYYHQWISTPDVLIRNKTIEQLNLSNKFRHVVNFPKVSKIDYLLRGTIKAIEELDEKDSWMARVKIDFELIEMESQELVWQKTVEKNNPVEKKEPFFVVKGINESVKQCIEDVQHDIVQLFND